MTSQRGVFVTGTDTGIGKTLVSAILCRAWNATYWKPLQTGLADEEGDTPTVRDLAGLSPSRVIPPAYAFQAPLAPLAAGELENVTVNPGRLVLPQVREPLVVEGAGGLLVPVREDMMIVDLIEGLGLPVVLVTRSGLGTINHTLLSLEALRRRGIPVMGIVPVGPPGPGNERDMTRFGKTNILFRVPQLDNVTEDALARIARHVPLLDVAQTRISQ